jgi:tungstate transport system substrate-binding protein
MQRISAVLVLICLSVVGTANAQSSKPSIVLATTTSTQDTGLLDHLVPLFQKQHGIAVKVVAVGTGEALAMGRRGDADVLLVHSRPAEDKFMAEGFGLLRLDVMHNEFLLVGPKADPAQAAGLGVVEAFRRIAEQKALFVSRGDDSGTHNKERALWKKAAVDPDGASWYVSAGQGMGETARIASEKRAYLLIDKGTFLALRATLDLRPISQGGSDLANPYGVIVVSAERLPRVHAAEARTFADWLISTEVQKAIGAFGKERFGEALFVPDAIR